MPPVPSVDAHGPIHAIGPDPVCRFARIRVRDRLRVAALDARRLREVAENERALAARYRQLTLDLAAEAARIQRHIDLLELGSVRATAPCELGPDGRPCDGPTPPTPPTPVSYARKSYAPRALGDVDPPRTPPMSPPPPPAPPVIISWQHVTNLGTLLDVMG